MNFLKGVKMNKMLFFCTVVAGFMCGILCASQDYTSNCDEIDTNSTQLDFFGKACEIDDKNATLEVPMKFNNHGN